MQFLIAANKLHKVFAKQCVESLNALGYKWTMFNLGGLGFGLPFPVQDKTFRLRGHYQTTFTKRQSRGLHKPHIIARFLEMKGANKKADWIAYIDADTIVRQTIDEVAGNYDIGVTVRRASEWARDGKVNAGVLFFRPTPRTRNFVRRWISETQRIGNDQEALNSLLSTNLCTIAEFRTDIYNWYYFPNPPPTEAKILHFKASAINELALRRKAWGSIVKQY